MKVILQVKSIALVLLLLCSVCVVPVMAADKQTSVVEDGVHLLKFDTSPTKLDPQVYMNMDVVTNFVVEGNQNYWVRIGSEKTKTLSTHELSGLICYGGFLAVAGVTDGVIALVTLPPALAGAPPTFGGSVALYYVGVGVATAVIDGGLAWFATKLCPAVEKQFVTNKYRYVASDGTIFLGIAKTNTAGIAELKKDGLDITTLTLLSTDGKPTPNTIASKLKKIELVKKSELKSEPTLIKSEKQNTLHLPNQTRSGIKVDL